MNFISAHNHPESPLTSASISSFLKKTKELGLGYIAFADQGHMMASHKCYIEATKKGIKPILGVEFYFKDSKCHLVEGTQSEKARYFTITIYAKDQESFQSLSKYVSKTSGISIAIGNRYYPTIDWEELEEISKLNVTAVTGGPNCIIAKHSLVGRADISVKYLDKLLNLFGNRLYLAITPLEFSKTWKPVVRVTINGKEYSLSAKDRVETNSGSKIRATELVNTYRHKFIKNIYINKIKFKVNKEYTNAVVENGFSTITSGDILLKINTLLLQLANHRQLRNNILISSYSYYPEKEDKIVQDMKLGDESRIFTNYHLMSTEEVKDYFENALKINYLDDLVKNTHIWAEEFKDFKLEYSPRLPACDEDSLQKTMRIIRENGRMKWDDPVYVERLKEEIEVIHKNGKIDLLPYFFPIAEIFNEYMNNGLLVGSSRGSCGASLLVYLIGITNLNPLKYNLSFSRFLSKTRILGNNLPDVDVDFCSKSFLPTILNKKWPNKWGQSSTRGMMRLKSSILDANRFVNKGEVEESVQKLSKGLPPAPQGVSDSEFVFGYEDENGDHVKGLIDVSESLKEYSESRPEEWSIVKNSLGVVRQPGVHASAVFITDDNISKLIPTFYSGGIPIVQPEAKYAEFAGLIKYDFLGLNTLNMINSAINLINQKNKENISTGYFSHNNQKTFIWDLPEDAEVYNMMGRGEVETLFQVSTKSMLPFVSAIKPKDMMDTATILALVRPGPLDFIDDNTGRNMAEEYIERRNGNSKGTIDILDKLIPETHSVLIFQEQITRIAIELGGMDLDTAENVRIAMGKKRMKDLQSLKPIFIEGAKKKVSESEANEVWNMMETFGRYGFNCIAGSQRIRTKQGLVEMSELATNFWKYDVEYVNIKTGELHHEKPSMGLCTGKKKVYSLRKDEESPIRATKHHKFLHKGEWLTIFDILDIEEDVAVSYEGVKECYDITMPSEHNFVLENGTIAHNCSHSVGYAMITYATAFLKYHYPLEWWSSVLTHSSEEEINQNLIKFVKDFVRAPDINTSQKEMTPDYNTNTVRQRLTLLKGLGDKQADKIISGRPYLDIKDFIRRGQCSLSLTKKLAHVGVLDSLFEVNTPTEKKVLIINQADIDVEYEDKIAEGKKPKAKKVADVDEEYIALDALTDFQIKKSIFPAMQIDLHEIALKTNKVNNLGRFPIVNINRCEVPFISGDGLSKIDSNDVDNNVTIGCVGYIINMEEFTYQKGAKKALKLFIDCSGYISEKVLWPDMDSGALSYPDTLKKGSIAFFIFTKRVGKPYTNITSIEVVKETIETKKKGKK